MSYAITIHQFWVDAFETVDLSSFFNVPGVAEPFRRNFQWRLNSLDNGDSFGAPLVWGAGGIGADGSLQPGIPGYLGLWDPSTLKFQNAFAYGDLMALQVLYDQEPTCACSDCNGPSACRTGVNSPGGHTVELYSGRFTHDIPLLSTAGVGAGGWSFGLSYFPGEGIDGFLGKNFMTPDMDFLVELGARPTQPGEWIPTMHDIEWVTDGHLRLPFNAQYDTVADEQSHYYVSEFNNSASVMSRFGAGENEEFFVKKSDGSVLTFFGFDDAIVTPGRLKSRGDRYGNTTTYTWEVVEGVTQLTRAVDSYGRAIDYRYYGEAFDYKLREVEDFLGRKLSFQYDAFGHLTAAVMPSIMRAAPGNTFPGGTAYVFQYDVDNVRPERRDDLLRIWYPNETLPYLDEATRTVDVDAVVASATPRFEIEYGQDPMNPYRFGSVVAETVGDPAGGVGGTITYDYEPLDPPVANVVDLGKPLVFRTTMTDRNGNITRYDFNNQEMPARVEVMRNRLKLDIPDDSSFVTWTRYNAQRQPDVVVLPEGNSIEYTYDDGLVPVTLPTPTLFVKRRGLLRQKTVKPGNIWLIPYREGSGEQEELTETYFYEPLFNQLCATVERRGNRIYSGFPNRYFTPQNGGDTPYFDDRSRYATITYFDYQKDEAITVRTDADLQARLNLTPTSIQALLDKAAGQMIAGGVPAGFPMGLGDINGDGTGDGDSSELPAATHLGAVVKVKHPSVRLIGATAITTQERAELFTNNLRGQLTTQTNPEGNLTVFVRYPISDPEGDGRFVAPQLGGKQYGQVKEIHVDADPDDVLTLVGADGDLRDFIPGLITRTNTPGIYQNLTTRYEGGGAGGCSSCAYDSLGNPLAVTDPRGFTTRFERNELGELFRSIAPAPYEFQVETYYDANRNVIRVDTEDQTVQFDSDDPTDACYAQFTPTGSGTTAHVPMKAGPGGTLRPGWFTNLSEFDLLDNKIKDDIDATGSHPANLVTRFAYDLNENLVKVTKPEGNTVEFDYDERNLRIAERVGYVPGPGGVAGAVTVSVFDGNGNLLQVVGPALRGAYDGPSNPGNGQAVTIHDFFRSGTPVEHIGDVVLENTYDGFDRVITARDAVGNVVNTLHDPDGRAILITREGPIGGPTPENRDGDDNVPLSIVTQRFDEAGRNYELQQEVFVAEGTTLPSERTVTHTGGGLAANSIANGHTQQVIMLQDGGIVDYYVDSTYVLTRTVFDRIGRAASVIADNTSAWMNEYDGADRRMRVIDPLGNLVQFVYDGNANVTHITRTEQCTITTPTITDEAFRSGVLYDALDRPVVAARQGADGSFESHLLSCMSLALWTAPNTTMVTRIGYDSRGNRLLEVDPKGNTCISTFDGASRETQFSEHMRVNGQGSDQPECGTFLPTGGASVTSASLFDANGRTLQLVDARGSVTKFEYDSADRRKQVSYHDGSTCVCTYNLAGDLATYTDANGTIGNRTFDALGRLTAISLEKAVGVIGTNGHSFEYDGLSRLTLARDFVTPSVDVSLRYDSLSRVIEDAQQHMSLGCVTNTRFSSHSPSALAFPQGRQIHSSFDALYRRTSITEIAGDVSIAAWDFYGPDRVAELRLGNGLVQTMLNNARTHSAVSATVGGMPWGNRASDQLGYDGTGRMITKRYLASDTHPTTHVYENTNALIGFTTSYDRVGNKLYERHLHAESRSYLYEPFIDGDAQGGYDSLDRLRKVQRGSLSETGGADSLGGGAIVMHLSLPNAIYSRTTGLDHLGNWRRNASISAEGTVSNEVRQHDALNRITRTTAGAQTIAFTYDGAVGRSNGNLQSDGECEYEWDALNRLVRVQKVTGSPALIAEYTYDALNRRTRKVVSNGGLSGEQANETVYYYYHGLRCIEEHNSLHEPTKQYVWGDYIDELLQQTLLVPLNGFSSGSSLYPIQDIHYRTIALADASGTIREAYDFDVHGSTIIFRDAGSPPPPVAFESTDTQVSAATCDFLFTGQRFDAETGLYYFKCRFYSPIWARFLSKDPASYAALSNSYEYVRANPARLLDPLGLFQIQRHHWFSQLGGKGQGVANTFCNNFDIDDYATPMLGLNQAYAGPLFLTGA